MTTTDRAVATAASTDTPGLTRLRDEVTLEHLLAAAGDGVHDLEVVRLQRDWWDGARYSTRAELRWHRLRWWVVEDDRELVALPARRRRARRMLARRRALEPAAALCPLLTGPTPPVSRPRGVELLAPQDRRVARAARRRLDTALASRPVDGQLVLLFDSDQPGRQPPARSSTRRVSVHQSGDWLSCAYADCGGLRLLAAPGQDLDRSERCPLCRRY